MNKQKLESLLEELAGAVTRPRDYDGEGMQFQVVSGLVQQDSFLAGILFSILEGAEITPDARLRLRRFPLTGTVWTLGSGVSVDISDNTQLLSHARLLDKTQSECVKILDGVH
jgi:hypothetical protein